MTTEEYEQGTYVYFDYNIMHDDLQTGWCYRRKENFTFRWVAACFPWSHKHLEDAVVSSLVAPGGCSSQQSDVKAWQRCTEMSA